MIYSFIVWISIFIAIVFFVVYGIYIVKPTAIIKDYVPDCVNLPDGSIISITDYPKIKATCNFMEKGICENDMVICDPEDYPKIHVHDTVVANNDNIYVVDTCHKDGSYTLKRPGEKLERQNRSFIKYVAKYTIKQPYDDIIDVVL